MKGWGKLEIPEKTRRTEASSGTIPSWSNPGMTRPGFEPGSPWWEASSLTAQPPGPGFIRNSNQSTSVRSRTMPLVGGFSRGSPVCPVLKFRRCSILYLTSPSSALKTSLPVIDGKTARQFSDLRRRGDERADAHFAVAPSAPTLLGLGSAKFLQPGVHLKHKTSHFVLFSLSRLPTAKLVFQLNTSVLQVAYLPGALSLQLSSTSRPAYHNSDRIFTESGRSFRLTLLTNCLDDVQQAVAEGSALLVQPCTATDALYDLENEGHDHYGCQVCEHQRGGQRLQEARAWNPSFIQTPVERRNPATDAITTILPTRITGFDSQRGRSQIFASGNHAGRCSWLKAFFGDLPYSRLLHSSAAPYLVSTSSALKISMLKVTQISQLNPNPNTNPKPSPNPNTNPKPSPNPNTKPKTNPNPNTNPNPKQNTNTNPNTNLNTKHKTKPQPKHKTKHQHKSQPKHKQKPPTQTPIQIQNQTPTQTPIQTPTQTPNLNPNPITKPNTSPNTNPTPNPTTKPTINPNPNHNTNTKPNPNTNTNTNLTTKPTINPNPNHNTNPKPNPNTNTNQTPTQTPTQTSIQTPNQAQKT
ncbi:hypothetical protein PR048_033237 [Dryococelus australis]|uniref:Uncharacterized protein n=1 Tax=Dryococelus australis TaxID=614101 RepID=A0ABQ9FZP7_9NEOP|nr:hypothetical protein PR048_033237 [Dryococelus australis]